MVTCSVICTSVSKVNGMVFTFITLLLNWRYAEVATLLTWSCHSAPPSLLTVDLGSIPGGQRFSLVLIYMLWWCLHIHSTTIITYEASFFFFFWLKILYLYTDFTKQGKKTKNETIVFLFFLIDFLMKSASIFRHTWKGVYPTKCTLLYV